MAPNKKDYELLLEYQRSGLRENSFLGALAIYSSGRVIHRLGEDPIVYARSLLKPFYTKPFAKSLESLNWKQKAISLSSHNGSRKHSECAKSLLPENKRRLLKTPQSLPLIQDEKDPVLKKTKWTHNSSGHHAGILRGLLDQDENTKDYIKKSHTVYHSLVHTLEKSLGKSYTPKKVAQDGDGLPTLAMPLSDIAKLYAYLYQVRDEDWIWQAFSRQPFYIGGKGRLDTAINKLGQGDLIAKEGADGLLAVGLKSKDHLGSGFVIKMAHGWDPHPTWRVASQILKRFGYQLRPPESPAGQKVVLNPQIDAFRTL